MIYINDKIKDKIEMLDFSDLYVVADFDKTITSLTSSSSWQILEKSNFICEEYTIESQKLRDIYHSIEFDFNIDPDKKEKLIFEWYTKNISLFVEFGLKEDIVNNASSNINFMKFRNGGKKFLEDMYKRKIPVIIISAGIGNFIEQFLKYNDCMFSNIHILSNFIKFENGIAVGIGNDIIHSQNKNIVSFNNGVTTDIENKNNILLFGDNLGDIKMVEDNRNKNIVRIGFLDYEIEKNLEVFKSNFDIVCTDNTSFTEIAKVLKK